MCRKVLIVVLLLFSYMLVAGDVATYVNLGFSPNSRYFLFGQYGINAETTRPYAAIYLVDVFKNTFVPHGVVMNEYDVEVEPGQEGLGALLTVVRENNELITRYEIDNREIGRVLYLLVNGDEPKSQLNFRDFQNDRTINVELHQQKFGAGSAVSSSFYLDLDVTGKDGRRRDYKVGLPNYKRSGVERYRIKQVCYTPDEKSLVLVIEKEEYQKEGSNIRYMVETVKLF
ncbi:MAG: DUF2259 domain-containing protein [Spirochaetales bacterium]|nr:DUF2259 domain-containing protein [Spirochaetales bacterium]